MFGLGSREKISDLRRELRYVNDKLFNAETQAEKILSKYNDLVELINQKGGMDFLRSNLADNTRSENLGRYGNPTAQFTAEEIKMIRILCHPDKHGNGSHGKKASKIFVKVSSM